MQDEEDNIDDFLHSIGLDIKPVSAEDAVLTRLTGGQGYKEIFNLRAWLRHELFCYFDTLKNGVLFTKKVLDVRTGEVSFKEITRLDYAKIRIKYYLRMKYLPYFYDDISGLGKADIDKTVDLVVEQEEIKPIIASSEEDLPKNGLF